VLAPTDAAFENEPAFRLVHTIVTVATVGSRPDDLAVRIGPDEVDVLAARAEAGTINFAGVRALASVAEIVAVGSATTLHECPPLGPALLVSFDSCTSLVLI